MQFVCDAAGALSWFRIETEAEAIQESALMEHAVEKHFRRAQDAAAQSWQPGALPYIEQDIGRAAHIRRSMPVFLTLRDAEGAALVTAMLPPGGRADAGTLPVVVGRHNSDPYPEYGAAIEALGRHFGLGLDRSRCYPYRRG
jgi:hypothetical protein